MISIQKALLILLLITISLGFKLTNSDRWSISEQDPTLWIKVCDGMLTQTYVGNSLPIGDSLYNNSPTVQEVVQTVIDDFNDISSSYLRLALYPTDPDNPGTPITGDSTFTAAKAAIRTIDLCYKDPSNPFVGGYARFVMSGNDRVGCEIVLESGLSDDVFNFIQVLTHEMGHCMGLAHDQETEDAIMSYNHDDDEYRLLLDDRMAMVYLFPKAGIDLEESPSYGLSCGFK